MQSFASPTLGKLKFDARNDFLTDRTKMVLSKIIQEFKRKCTLEIRNMGFKNFKWQSSFYDRSIGMKKNYSISENI